MANQIRGLREWPVATAAYQGTDGSTKNMKILEDSVPHGREGVDQQGEILDANNDKGIIVKAGSGCVFLKEIQPEGKKAMADWPFWQGTHLKRENKFQ